MEKQIRNIPMVALRGMTIMPEMVVHFDVSRAYSIQAIQQVMQGEEQQVFLVAQRELNIEDPDLKDVFEIGTIATIKQVIKLSKNMLRVLVTGEERARLISLEKEEGYLNAQVEVIEEPQAEEEVVDNPRAKNIQELFLEYAMKNGKIPKDVITQVADEKTFLGLVNQIAANVPLDYLNLQDILEETDLNRRYEVLAFKIANEMEVMHLKEDVDPETWQLAQQVKRTVRRTDTTGVANPFTGLVFCADCGAKMYNHRGIRKNANGKEYPSDFYNCSTYCLTIERETKQCFSHSVSTRALTELVLETIRTTAGYALANRKAFIQKVRSISQVRQQEAAKELSRRVAKAKKRMAELDILIKKLYETYALGRMDEKRFGLLSAGYEKEQDELEQALAADQASLDQFNEDTDRADKFLALAKKYTDFSELTPAMLNEFVEKIMVHAPDRSTGERVQEIEIYLKFIGKFDVPMPEPTPEELAAEEARRQRRARDHAKYLRQKERKRKIAEGLIVPGEPYHLVCQCCGEPFQSIRPNAKFCKPACREKFYRQQKRAAKQEKDTPPLEPTVADKIA